MEGQNSRSAYAVNGYILNVKKFKLQRSGKQKHSSPVRISIHSKGAIHAVNNLKDLTEYEDIPETDVELPGETKTTVLDKGITTVNMNILKLLLTDVYHISTLQFNLLFCAKLN